MTRPLLELIELLVVLALVIPGLRFLLAGIANRRGAEWTTALARRRFTLLLFALLAVIAINVGEDVLDGETQAIDTLALLALNDRMPPVAVRFFETITLTGSWMFLTPLTTVAVLALWSLRCRFEALLLAGSVTGGALTVYALKTLVGRERPALWDTETYWGSSFPSGHTLVVASFAIATVVCTVRLRPALRNPALVIAVGWIALVGASRLVLGVHWPTDVLVAACIGAALPLAISIAHALHRHRDRLAGDEG